MRCRLFVFLPPPSLACRPRAPLRLEVVVSPSLGMGGGGGGFMPTVACWEIVSLCRRRFGSVGVGLQVFRRRALVKNRAHRSNLVAMACCWLILYMLLVWLGVRTRRRSLGMCGGAVLVGRPVFHWGRKGVRGGGALGFGLAANRGAKR